MRLLKTLTSQGHGYDQSRTSFQKESALCLKRQVTSFDEGVGSLVESRTGNNVSIFISFLLRITVIEVYVFVTYVLHIGKCRIIAK